MATLNSPGVQVQVIDESFYTPAAPGTVPMLFVASAQDKTNPSGTTALGTTAANAGKVWLMTGQRDLTDTFGTPVFYTDSSSNPLHGHELNEYGLQAAYSVLGVSSRAYIVRADLDTTQLVPASSAPVGDPVSGTYWVDTASSVYGIKEWNNTTKKFTVKTPRVLDYASASNLFNGTDPATGVGQQGDYCLVLTKNNTNTLFYKTTSNVWTAVVNGFDSPAKTVRTAPHYQYPDFVGFSSVTGSVWITSTSPSNGADWSVKYYNNTTKSWSKIVSPLFDTLPSATYTLDPVGGKNIGVGTVFIETDYENNSGYSANFKLWRRANSGVTSIVGTSAALPTTVGTHSFTIRETSTSTNWSSVKTVSITVSTSTDYVASLIPAALSASGIEHVTASFDAITNKLTMTHSLGGDFELTDGTHSPLNKSGYTAYNMTTQIGTANLYAAQVMILIILLQLTGNR